MRYNLRHLLIGVALVALILGAVRYGSHRWSYRQNFHQAFHLAFSPDGKQLAAVVFKACDDRNSERWYLTDVSRTVALFDTSDLSHRTVVQYDFRPGSDSPDPYLWRGSDPIGFADNGQLMLVLDWGGGRIRQWDVASGSWQAKYNVKESDIVAFDHSSDGKMLVLCRRGGHATIWDTGSWTHLTPLPVGAWPGKFSPDGKYLAFNEPDGVQVWNVQDRKLVRTFHNDRDVQGRVTFKEFSLDGDIIAVRRPKGLHMCSLGTGQEQRINLDEYVEIPFGPEQKTTIRHKAATIGIDFSPDGRLLAAWGGYGLRFFDKSHGWKLQRAVADRTINCLAFSPDGKTYATGDQQGKLAIWDTATGKEVRSTELNGRISTQ